MMIFVVYLGHGNFHPVSTFIFLQNSFSGEVLTPLDRAPNPLANSSNFVPINGFPVVKALSS